MKIKITILFAFLSFLSTTTFAQGFEAPSSEDKAVVYFVRPSVMGGAINFRFFDNDQYIGRFNGGKYMRYECEPGEHLFWARSENRDWVTAELEAGKIYVIEAQGHMGGLKVRVQLEPIASDNEKKMKKINKLVNKKSAVTIKTEDVSKKNADLKEYIKESLEKYESKFSKERTILHLSADMNHGA